MWSPLRHEKNLDNILEKEFKGFKKSLIFGACVDKDIKGISEQLDAVADKVILTKADNPRAADPVKSILPYFRRNKPSVTFSVEAALDMLNEEISEQEVAVITGSLFVVGEARGLWQKLVRSTAI